MERFIKKSSGLVNSWISLSSYRGLVTISPGERLGTRKGAIHCPITLGLLKNPAVLELVAGKFSVQGWPWWRSVLFRFFSSVTVQISRSEVDLRKKEEIMAPKRWKYFKDTGFLADCALCIHDPRQCWRPMDHDCMQYEPSNEALDVEHSWHDPLDVSPTEPVMEEFFADDFNIFPE